MVILSPASLRNFSGVHPDLVAVVNRAVRLSEQDFAVLDGVRTIEEQRENVARGVSKTMESKHLPQTDGFGHAVDLVPLVNGKLRWEWPPIFKIAEAMRSAANELGTPIRWGGNWARINNTQGTMEDLSAEYVAERHRIGSKHVFLDGPHYELA